jgi:hypothetical protein
LSEGAENILGRNSRPEGQIPNGSNKDLTFICGINGLEGANGVATRVGKINILDEKRRKI